MQPVLQFVLYAILFTDVRQVCVSPIVTQATGLSTESIYVQWLDFANEPGTLYALELIPTGQTQSGQPTVDSIADDNATVIGLQQGTIYDIYIRALCTEGPSDWTGPFNAITYIDNGSACGIDLAIPDDNCPEYRTFPIQVDEFSGLALGDDLFLSSIDLIVQHPWMADLSFALRSPSGATAILMANHGVGVQNVGNPDDSLCTEVLSLTMSACMDLSNIANGQQGAFLPDASFEVFHDQGAATGTWFLEVCDKASDDVGRLLFVQLNFTENACDFPPTLAAHQVLDTIATVIGLDDESCDSLVLMVWNINDPADTTTISLECAANPISIGNLVPGQSYMYIAQKICNGHSSDWTCPELLETTCDYISLKSEFDENVHCVAECSASCPLNDSIWTNAVDDDMDWIAYQEATPTEFTGPNASRLSEGTYLYTETSGDLCQDGAEAILSSRCLFISGTEDGCDLTFWYHMYGTSVGTLLAEISVDGGATWEELFNTSGNQGDVWHQANISLYAYNDTLASLRIRAIAGEGFLGDIAIDDLMFFGTTDGAGIERCYFLDADMDGFGTADSMICRCALTPPAGYTSNTSDCDDSDAEVSPDATEVPCNLRDDNCNAEIDEGVNPDPVDYVLTLQQDASCSGVSDGALEIVTTGGLAPFTFQWSNGGDSSYLSGLSPGFYQATITDANGCIAVTDSFEISSLIVIEYFLIAVSDPSCVGQTDGFISGIVQGGTEPYSFLWSNGDTTQDVTGLPDGVYTVTITDALGCSIISDDIQLAATSTISVSILQFRHVSCYGGSNGLIRVVASGGAVFPFEYVWSNGDSTGLTTDLIAGDYTVTITDSLGCMLIAGPYRIVQPPPLEVQVISATPPLCNSTDDGSINISVNGGTAPYFYTWSHGAFSEDVSGLTNGEYSVTVADLHGCDTVVYIALQSPDMLTAMIDTVMHVQCPGDSTGSIFIEASGGTPPYRYDWSTGSSDTNFIEDLPTGVYSVTLSDASGCKSSIRDIEVNTLNTPLVITFDSVQNVSCYGDSSGYVVASVTGGDGPFWFNWSIGKQHLSEDRVDTLSSLVAGNYQVTITGAAGCIGISGKAIVQQPERLIFTLDNLTNNICYGDSYGSIDIGVQGGTPPYTYSWSNGATSQDLFDLAAGLYSLVITDSLGCIVSTQNLEIDEPDSIVVDFEIMNEMGMMSDGWALVLASGGTSPYMYQWDTAAGSQTTALVVGLSSGTYYVTITDNRGCVSVDSVFIDRITAVDDPDDNAIKIYPNPASEWVMVEGVDLINDIRLIDINGRVFDIVAERAGSHQWSIGTRAVSPGTYLLDIDGHYFVVVIIH